MSNLSTATPDATVRQALDYWYIVAEYHDHPDAQQALAGPFLGFTEAERNYVAVVSLYHLIIGQSRPTPDAFNYYRGDHPHRHPEIPPQWVNPLIGLNAFGAPLLPEQQSTLESVHQALQAIGPTHLQPQWLQAWQSEISADSYHAAQEAIAQTLQCFQHPESFWNTLLAFDQGVFHPFIDYALAIGLFIPPTTLQHIFQQRIRFTLAE